MLHYYNKEERLMRESVPTEITGARDKNCLLPNPTTMKESKIEMREYFKNRQFILRTLPTNSRAAFILAYGINGEKPLTIEQIAQKLKLTKEKVRQILLNVSRKLRHPLIMNTYMVLTDSDVDYTPNNDLLAENSDDILTDFDVEKLKILRNKKLKEIQEQRYKNLSKEEKEADFVLQRLLNMDLKEFITALKINGVDFEKLSQVLLENTYPCRLNVQTLLSTEKSILKENGLSNVVVEIEKVGLHFEEEAEYVEDFNKLCYSSMNEVGLKKFKSILPKEEKVEEVGVLGVKIEDLDLSVRSCNCLIRAGKKTVEDLVKMTKQDLINVRNLGKTSIEEIIAKLHSLNLNLRPENFSVESWIAKLKDSNLEETQSKEAETKNSANVNNLDLTIGDLNLSVRSYNCLIRAGKKTLEDLVKMTKHDFIYVRNLGKTSIDEVIAKIRSLGFDICPNNIDSEKWIQKYRKSTKAEQTNSNKKLDINDIPKEYRKTYAIGAGLLVKEDLQNGLVSRAVNNSKINATNSKSALPKLKINKEKLNDMTDLDVLKAISKDSSVIELLEVSFIVKYKNDLLKIILADSTLDVEKRFEILQFVSDAKQDDLLK